MLNTFDNNPKRQEKRAERERRIEEMNASVQIASDELFRTATTTTAAAATDSNSSNTGGDAVDSALERLGMSLPLGGTSAPTGGGVFGASASQTQSQTDGASKSSGGGGSDGDDEASSGPDDGDAQDDDDGDGSKKSGRSGTDSSFNNPQYSKSFGAGMHAPPLGATEDAKRFLWDDDEPSASLPSSGITSSSRDLGHFSSSSTGPTQRNTGNTRFGQSTRQLGALAPVDLTPEQRQRNLIDPRALPSALAAQGGYFGDTSSDGRWGGNDSFYGHEENSGPGIGQRIVLAIGAAGSAVGGALSSVTTTTKTKAAGIAWPGRGGSGSNSADKAHRNNNNSYSDFDVDARINNLKNLNTTINLHSIQCEADIYATAPRGAGFPGQLMLSTAATSAGRAVTSATDSPSKRRRLCLVVVASAAIIAALTVGTTTDVASDLANHLPTLGGGFGSSSGGSLKDLQRTESNPRFASIRTRILHSGVSDPDALATPTEWPPGPQYQAVQWLAEGDARQVHPDDEYLIQRYALATFWISTYGRVMEEEEMEHSHHYGSSRRLADDGEDNYDDEHEKENDKVEGEMWLRRKNWMTKHGLCSWEGVQCHHRPGGSHEETHYDEDNYVTVLHLADNAIRGPLPQELFTALTDVKMLSMPRNKISGTLPAEIGQTAASLLTIDLRSNKIEGTIPATIGSIETLKKLELGDNRLEGNLPKELGELSELEELGLYSNRFSGEIPINIAALKLLKSLYLDSNDLSGTIPPSLAALTSLVDLRLRENKLKSTIPPGLSSLEALEVLYLDSNELSGSIPYQLSKLRSLEELHLHRNELEGTLSPSLFTLDRLTQFYADHNRISGSIPDEIGGLRSIQQIYLYENALTSSIPPSISDLSSLERFRVEYNMLSGALPYDLGSNLRLEYLSVNANNLRGDLPESMRQMINLQTFHFSGNNIKGSVSEEICKLTEDNLVELTADCKGDEPRFECSCCSECL